MKLNLNLTIFTLLLFFFFVASPISSTEPQLTEFLEDFGSVKWNSITNDETREGRCNYLTLRSMTNNGLNGPRIWVDQFSLDSPDPVEISRIAQPSLQTDVTAGATIIATMILEGECKRNNVAFTDLLNIEINRDGTNDTTWTTDFTFPGFGAADYVGGYNDFTMITHDVPSTGISGSVRLAQIDPAGTSLGRNEQIWGFIRIQITCNPLPIGGTPHEIVTFSDDFNNLATNWDVSASGITSTCSGASPRLCFDAQGLAAPVGYASTAGSIVSKNPFDFTSVPLLRFTIQSEADSTPNTDDISEASRLIFEYSLVNPVSATGLDWNVIRSYSGHKSTNSVYAVETPIQRNSCISVIISSGF